MTTVTQLHHHRRDFRVRTMDRIRDAGPSGIKWCDLLQATTAQRRDALLTVLDDLADQGLIHARIERRGPRGPEALVIYAATVQVASA